MDPKSLTQAVLPSSETPMTAPMLKNTVKRPLHTDYYTNKWLPSVVENPRKYYRIDFKIYHNSGKAHDFQYSYSEWGLLIQQTWNGFKNKVDMSSMQYFIKRIII